MNKNLSVYVGLVSLIFAYGEQVFGKMDNYFGPILFLLILILAVLF